MQTQKNSKNVWKIILSGVDAGSLQNAAKSIESAAKIAMVKCTIVPLPNFVKRFDLRRSTCIYGASKEQYKLCVHKLVIILKITEIGVNINQILKNVVVPCAASINIIPPSNN